MEESISFSSEIVEAERIIYFRVNIMLWKEGNLISLRALAMISDASLDPLVKTFKLGYKLGIIPFTWNPTLKIFYIPKSVLKSVPVWKIVGTFLICIRLFMSFHLSRLCYIAVDLSITDAFLSVFYISIWLNTISSTLYYILNTKEALQHVNNLIFLNSYAGIPIILIF